MKKQMPSWASIKHQLDFNKTLIERQSDVSQSAIRRCFFYDDFILTQSACESIVPQASQSREHRAKRDEVCTGMRVLVSSLRIILFLP